MPALILTGHPCVGKTTFAHVLAERAKVAHGIMKVVIINEESACPDRTKFDCYVNSHAEKSTRAALKAEFDRHSGVFSSKAGDGGSTSSSTLIILDSLNYIKGYRYELHCISKESSDKHGVVWVRCDQDTAKRWNQQRSNQETIKVGEASMEQDRPLFYTDEIMEELVARYEPPNEKNRWDKPLYPVEANFEEGISIDDCKVVLQRKADEILEAFLVHSKPLKMGMSTQKPLAAEANVLHAVDNITQQVCSSLMEAQKNAPPGGKIPVSIGGGASGKETVTISLVRKVHLPELKRLRRQYVKWVQGHPPSDSSKVGIATSFLSYIETNV